MYVSVCACGCVDISIYMFVFFSPDQYLELMESSMDASTLIFKNIIISHYANWPDFFHENKIFMHSLAIIE